MREASSGGATPRTSRVARPMAEFAQEPSASPAPTLAARALVIPILGYRMFISPLLPPSCRFAPSCSEYAVGALRTHGAVRGLWLAIRSLARCHPFNPGGYDPVPPRPQGV